MRGIGRLRAWWVPVTAGVGAAVAGVAAVTIVGFLVIGVLSGSVDWPGLLTERVWDPASGHFGAAAMIWGSAAVTAIALGIAAPLGWAVAVALNELAPARWRRWLRAGAEILAIVPSIVYGLLGIVYLRPFVAARFGVSGGDSLLAAGLVLAVMVLPTIVAVSIDTLARVPAEPREAAASLGLTRTEVIRAAVLPQARRGLAAAALLGLARALGETVAVFLVIGRADGRLPNPTGALEALVHPGQTLTTKLNSPEVILAGTSGPHWAALCALGLMLLTAVTAFTFVGFRHAQPRRRRRPRDHWIRGARRARHARDQLTRGLLSATVLLPVVLGVLIVVAVVTRGSAALDPSFWLDRATGANGGGIRDQLLGTLLLVAVAGVLAAPVGMGLGLVIAEYSGARASQALRTATVTLGGVPSIILGLAGYYVLARQLGWGKTWFAGSILLAVIAVPPIATSVASAIDTVPTERRETALAVGLRRDQVVRSVLVPRALPGLVTGLLLGLARAAGETAPLLFAATVFSGGEVVPHGVTHAPVSALTTHLFSLAQDSADPHALDTAWGTAVVLLVVAGVLLLAAVPTRRRLERGT
jgi:phosphate transport system permease protein